MAITIRFVEDSASVRQAMNGALKREDYEVMVACDGQDALIKPDGCKARLIISDLSLPNIDGIAFIQTADGGFAAYTGLNNRSN